MRAVWIVLMLIPLAGCLGGGDGTDEGFGPGVDAEPSAAVYGILPPEEVWVTSSVDGKRIHNAVYRPDGEGPFPVFINFSPYWGDTAMTEGDHFSQYMIHEYVPRGYIVVLSAIRGTGHSEGCFQIGGDLELEDAYDVVDFFASMDGSNGAVAAGGKSYDSTTQNGLIAKFPHPALKGVFHVSGITDMYRYNYREGVPYLNGLAFTPRYFGSQGMDEYGIPGLGTGGGTFDEDADSLQRLLDDLACSELPEHVLSGEGSALDGLKDAYWQERDWVHFMPDSSWNGSIFFVHGLQDWNVKPDHILPWLDALPDGVQVKGWLHQETENLGHLYPMRDDWNATMLAWLDHVLKGKDNGFSYGFEIQGSDHVWRASDGFPPTDTVLNGTTDASGTIVFEPQQNQIDTKEPGVFQEAVRLSGVPSLEVTVRSPSADPVAWAGLYDVAPDGSRQWIDEATLRLALDDDLGGPRPWIPGSSLTVELTFYPLDHVVEAGHALQVIFGTSTPGPGTPPDLVVTPVQTVVTYGDATIHLPTAPLDSAVVPQPGRTPCFAC